MLERLVRGLQGAACLLPGAEITLEVNPEDVNPEAVSAWRGTGVNRVSMGIQSLDEDELRILGRRHSADTARRALDRLLQWGFASVGVDLIYGTPGQGPDGWRRTLSAVLAQGPHHLSCYELTLSPETPLGRRVAAGRLRPPGEREVAARFLETSARLRDQGFVHYEISNFARPGHESRHNRKYWRRAPYLGLGPGAHSFLPPTRWWNPRSLDRWAERLERGHPPARAGETLTPEQERLERLWLGFRTREGLAAEVLDGVEGAERIAADLERSGLVTRVGRTLVPTPRGFLVSDSLPLLFAA
jgi:oxygen-independent coproporphyrinogen-3 oxidase